MASADIAKAENYIGIYGGAQFQGKGDRLRAMKDMNYKSTSDLYPATTSDIMFKSSFTMGVKAGRYLDSFKGFGVEVDAQYSRPDFKKQDVTINLDQVVNGLQSFTLNQEAAQFHMFSAGVNLLYRFDQFEAFKPYIGAGPAAMAVVVKGSDYSFGEFVSKGHGVGINAKAGVEIPINDRISFDTEYKFTYGKVKIDNFRSLSDITLNHTAHAINAGLRLKF